jgi:hypothetical protein
MILFSFSDGSTMPSDIDPAVRANCEKHGIDWVRARAEDMGGHPHAVSFRQWIYEYERTARERAELEHFRLSEESLEAARLSAETSRDAALASKSSAHWTMIAAIAAAMAALIPLLQAFKLLPK